MSVDIYFAFKIVYYVLLFIISIFCLFNFFNFSNNFKSLAFLIVCSSIVEISVYFIKNDAENYAYHILLPLNMLLFLYMFIPFWKNQALKQRLTLITYTFISLSLFNSFYNQEFDNYPSNGLALLCVLSVLFSLITLKNIINSKANTSLFTKPEFWLSITILVFFTFSYVYFTLYQFYSSIMKDSKIIYILFRIILDAYYILLTYTLFLNKKQNIESRS